MLEISEEMFKQIFDGHILTLPCVSVSSKNNNNNNDSPQMFAAAAGQLPGAGAPDEPAWTGFAMEQIMKTLSFVNSSLVQAPAEEKEKLAHKLDDTLYCAKVRFE